MVVGERAQSLSLSLGMLARCNAASLGLRDHTTAGDGGDAIMCCKGGYMTRLLVERGTGAFAAWLRELFEVSVACCIASDAYFDGCWQWSMMSACMRDRERETLCSSMLSGCAVECGESYKLVIIELRTRFDFVWKLWFGLLFSWTFLNMIRKRINIITRNCRWTLLTSFSWIKNIRWFKSMTHSRFCLIFWQFLYGEKNRSR